MSALESFFTKKRNPVADKKAKVTIPEINKPKINICRSLTTIYSPLGLGIKYNDPADKIEGTHIPTKIPCIRSTKK